MPAKKKVKKKKFEKLANIIEEKSMWQKFGL